MLVSPGQPSVTSLERFIPVPCMADVAAVVLHTWQQAQPRLCKSAAGPSGFKCGVEGLKKGRMQHNGSNGRKLLQQRRKEWPCIFIWHSAGVAQAAADAACQRSLRHTKVLGRALPSPSDPSASSMRQRCRLQIKRIARLQHWCLGQRRPALPGQKDPRVCQPTKMGGRPAHQPAATKSSPLPLVSAAAASCLAVFPAPLLPGLAPALPCALQAVPKKP